MTRPILRLLTVCLACLAPVWGCGTPTFAVETPLRVESTFPASGSEIPASMLTTFVVVFSEEVSPDSLPGSLELVEVDLQLEDVKQAKARKIEGKITFDRETMAVRYVPKTPADLALSPGRWYRLSVLPAVRTPDGKRLPRRADSFFAVR